MQIALYFDPPSHHFFGDRLFDTGFAGHSGDQILAPYAHLKQYLNARGIEARTADYCPEAPDGKLNIYVSAGATDSYRRFLRRKDLMLSAFFAMECPTVEPGLYRGLLQAQQHFRRVFSWSDSASLQPFTGGALRCMKMHWPQSFDGVHDSVWHRKDRGFLVMINGNKYPRYRSRCEELYSERLKAVEYFGVKQEIDLYGVGWDGPRMLVGRPFVPGSFGKIPMPGTIQAVQHRLRSGWQLLMPDPQLQAARRVYKGFASSKSDVLSRYKFSICFENSVLKGWITEKIFDCFFAGTIPVYRGAPDIGQYIPPACFIDMRNFSGYGELRSYLKSLSPREVARFRESAREFLRSPAFYPFSKQAFAELFGRIIEEDAGVHLQEGPVNV